MSLAKFTLEIPIKPKPWARTRANFKTGAFFNSKEMRNYQDFIKYNAKKVMKEQGTDLLLGRLQVKMYFNFQKPKQTKFDYPSKGDTSNYVKNVEDALNKVVFHDDSQIAILYAEKRWAGSDGIYLTIEEF